MVPKVDNGFSFPNALFHIQKIAAVGLDSHKIPFIIIWDSIYYLKGISRHHTVLTLNQRLRLEC